MPSLTSALPAGGTQLWDPQSNTFLDLMPLIKGVRFINAIRVLDRMRSPDFLEGVSRQELEELVDQIQITLLVGAPPNRHFPSFDEEEGMSQDYRDGLLQWEKRFKAFLAEAKGSRFHLS